MNLILVGTNYKTAPIEIREKVSVSKKRLSDVFHRLFSFLNIEGAVILSTCNRMEIYVSSNDAEPEFLVDFIINYFDLCNTSKKYFYIFTGFDAIRHLFRVSSGLESQIIGEPEILGQVKDAYIFSHSFGWTDRIINKVFLKSIQVGKKIRRETKISQGNISYGSVIFSMAKDFLDTLENKDIILIGTGKMVSLMISYLKDKKAKVSIVANKHFDMAVKLASQVNGKAIKFDEIGYFLNTADLLISSTSAPHFILKKSDFEKRLSYKPLLIFDIAVPRDIDPEARNISGLYLYDIDDLTTLIDKNMEMRKREKILAQEIIEEEVIKFIEEIECLQNYALAQEIAN